MSCGCGSTPYADYGYNGLCRQDLPYPQVSHESVPSLIDNLVTALYGGFYDPATGANSGGIIKTVVNGRIVWKTPCSPETASPVAGIPANPGEGILCYILRVFSAFQAGDVTPVNTINIYNKTLVSPSLTGSISCNSLASFDTLGNAVTLNAASLYGALAITCDSLGNCPTLGSTSQATSAYLLNTSISGGSSTNRTINNATLPGASLSAVTISGNSSLSLGTSSVTLPANCVGTSQIVNGSILSGDLNAGITAFDSLGNWTIPSAFFPGIVLAASNLTVAGSTWLSGNLNANAVTLTGGSLSGAKISGGSLTGSVELSGFTSNNGTFYNSTLSGASITSASVRSDTLAADTFSGNSTADATFSLTGGNFINPTLGGSGFSLSSAFVTGKTDGSAASSGYLGEYVTATLALASAITLTTATAANVVSISLTAGDWDVYGVVDFSLAGGTSVFGTSGYIGGVSSTSGTLGAQDTYFNFPIDLNNKTGTFGFNVPTQRISVTTTTTIYLVAQATFSTGANTVKAYGTIRARRVR